MTSSDERFAREWMKGILDGIDPQLLDRQIHSPVDELTEAFLEGMSPPTSGKEFNSMISGFVYRLHAEAMRVKRQVTFEDALGEGIILLNTGFRGDASGYELAILSARSGGDAAESVVRIAELVKAREIDALISWTLEDAIAPLAWGARCRLVAGLCEMMGEALPADLRACAPTQLASFIIDLARLIYQVIVEVEERRPKGFMESDDVGTLGVNLFAHPDDPRDVALSERADLFSTAET